ncbi:MAG TPA: hypothetical protein PK156_51050, partial [Polyangium sp.]|nr:hypothetical protein [Polyangium sp.]
PVPGCSEEPVLRQPDPQCSAADLENTDPVDCLKRVCQNGMAIDASDDDEIPDDGNVCTLDSCSGGQAVHNPGVGACMVGGATGMCSNGECTVPCPASGDCNDNDTCTTDSCDMTSMMCSFTKESASYDDGNDCTVDDCAANMPTHTPKPANTPCGTMGNGMCDGNGVCKGCKMDEDCPDEPCLDRYCDLASTTCQGMPKPNGDLPDDMVGDCKQPACLDGMLMMNPSDTDLPVDNNECTTDACNAGMPSNEPLPVESMCSAGVCNDAMMCVQCVTAGNCMPDHSCSMSMCFDCNDGVMNGTESDIDCGRDCSLCADGKACADNADCGSAVCDNNLCVSCGDGTINGTESDIDCGGMQCPKCNTGQNCNVGGDCAQGVCSGGKCAAANCMDGVKNGAESDIDCGGGTCPKCGAGKTCTKNSDCVTGTMCVNGMCN